MVNGLRAINEDFIKELNAKKNLEDQRVSHFRSHMSWLEKELKFEEKNPSAISQFRTLSKEIEELEVTNRHQELDHYYMSIAHIKQAVDDLSNKLSIKIP